MRSVPGAVATGSNARHGRGCPENNPVATALGTDCVIVVDFFLVTRESRHWTPVAPGDESQIPCAPCLKFVYQQNYGVIDL
jgi:hypothetical protein